ncbi:hypothetical protein ABZ742_04275 [Streptomyces albogriseolus]|uniref:hypothetical protein n=1 Tax=Streptomyces albogriseolus TaxID=1887 RepID=UPI00345FA5E2
MTGIDPRLYENNEVEDPGQWLQEKFTVIVDFWIAEHLKDPEHADEALRRNGFTKVADRLVELFGERWGESRARGPR